MKLIIVAALAAITAPSMAIADAGDVDSVIRKLDITSFANSIGTRRVPGKTTFADYDFVAVEKTGNSARLVRKADGRSKSFVILSSGPASIRVCFHDSFVVMPESTLPLHYNTTAALVVSKSRHGMWTAAPFRGGFVNCHNDPATP